MLKKYRAFISYSHQNEKFAKWLHRSLERYRIPNGLLREYPHLNSKLYPIFRDREELPSSSNLGSNILSALKNSEYLIVICSMESAKSFWVNQEIIDFKSLHGEDKVLAIILDGEPNALSKESFNDKLECFPEALKYKVFQGKLTQERTEPIAADVRKGKDGYKFGRLKLIAGLLGVGLEELYQREAKREKQKRWIRTVLTLFILGLISLLALNLFLEKNKAQKETKKVKELLFQGVMEKGFIYRDHLHNPLKAKYTFAKALQIQSNQQEKKIALMVYNHIQNPIKLKTIKDNKELYTSLIKESKKSLLTQKKHKGEKLSCCGKYNMTFFLKDSKDNVLSSFQKPTIYYDKGRRMLDQQINDVFFIDDGKEIVSWDYASNINFWHRKDNSPIKVLHHGSQLNGVRFSKDETEILSWGNDGKVKLWNRTDNKPILEFKHNSWVRGAVFSRDEQKILSWSTDGEIKLWSRLLSDTLFSLKDNALLTFKHANSVNGAMFIDNEQRILSWGDDGIVRLWSIKDKKLIAIMKHKSRILGVKFIKNTKEIISWSDDGEVKNWQLKTKKYPSIFDYRDGFEKGFWEGSFSKDNQNIFYWNTQEKIRLYNLNDKKLLYAIDQKEFLDGALLSKSQTKILSWDSPTDKRTLNTRVITDIGRIKVWSIHQKEPLVILKHDKPIMGVSFNKSENKILSWSKDKSIKLWNIDRNKPLLVFKNKESIFYAQFYNNEKQILSCSIKGEVKLWNIQDGKSIVLVDFLEQKKIHGFIVSQDLETILLWNLNKSIYLWSKQSQKLLPIMHFRDWVNGAMFTKDHQEVLAWSQDGTLKLWSTKANKTLVHFKHGNTPIRGAIFSKNEKMILSWSAGGVAKLWSKKYTHPLLSLQYKNKGLFPNVIFEAKFTKDEKAILMMSRAGDIIRYELYPKEEKNLKDYTVKIELETGVHINEAGELSILDKKAWFEKKAKYK